jgi:hypothetical protein
MEMTRSQKTIGMQSIAFAIVGAAIIYSVWPGSSPASTASMVGVASVTISPEEITRSAGTMPVQEIKNLPVEKIHDMTFVFSDGD